MAGFTDEEKDESNPFRLRFLSPRSLAHILWLKRWPLLITWALLSVPIGGFLTMVNLPHTYSADTILRFPIVVGAQNNVMHDVAISEGESIVTLFTSYQVLEATVRKLGLRLRIETPDVFRPNTLTAVKYSDSLRFGYYKVVLQPNGAEVTFKSSSGRSDSVIFDGALRDGNVLEFKGCEVDFDPTFIPRSGRRAVTFRFISMGYAVSLLKNGLSVNPLGSSNFKVTLSDRDPFLVADILNTLRDQFLDAYYGTTQVQGQGVLVQMEQDLQQAKQRLSQSQYAITQYYADHPGLEQPGAAQAADNLSYVESRQRLDALEAQKSKVESAYQAKPAKDKQDERYFWALDLLSAMSDAGDPHASILRGRLTELNNQLTTLKATLGPEHPRLLDAYSKLDELYSEVDAAEKTLDQTLQQTEAELRQKVAHSAPAAAANVPASVRMELDHLNQVNANNQQIYDHLQEGYNRAKLATGSDFFKVTVVDEARPASYIPPSLQSRVAIAAAVVLLLALLLPALLSLFHLLLPKVWTPDDVRRLLRVKFLGDLALSAPPPFTSKKDALDPYLLYYGSAFTFSDLEGFRMIREECESFFGRPERAGKLLLMVTSALPEEGKTMISSNLALAFARKGKRTLLIDADFRLGRLAQAFQVAPTTGLDEMLGQEHLSREEFLRAATWCYMPSVQKNLVLLPRKNFNGNAGELISSEKFKAFVRMVGEQFDVVIIDTPPMAITSDPLAVAELTDGVIFVSRSGSTPLSQALAAVERLRERNVRVGAVLNGLRHTPVERDRYKKYAYYYEGGYRKGTSATKPSGHSSLI